MGIEEFNHDFLMSHTYKHYDLIIMNPPFSVGARHLLKAIEVQETSGGMIICLLNAETLRNPYTNERKELLQRLRIWSGDKFFREPRFIGRLTSNLHSKYLSQVNKFANYDFSYRNIKTVREEIALSLVKGVEDCILDLFDKLSARYSWDEDLKNTIHYYNGWKSNCCWKINRHVVLPLPAFR